MASEPEPAGGEGHVSAPVPEITTGLAGAVPPASAEGAVKADRAPSSVTPTLKPPTPIDAPALDPVMRVTVAPGPGGMGGAAESSVRGRVRVRLLVRSDGTVGAVDVLISSGDPTLDAAARRGLLRWRFAPALRDGVPIEAYLLLWVTFHAP